MTYPWGEDIDDSRANYQDNGDPWDNGTNPIGTYDGQLIAGFQTTDSPSPYGVYDMLGNAAEYTKDWWSNDHCVRGGHFNSSQSGMSTTGRELVFNSNMGQFYGFRCVIK